MGSHSSGTFILKCNSHWRETCVSVSRRSCATTDLRSECIYEYSIFRYIHIDSCGVKVIFDLFILVTVSDEKVHRAGRIVWFVNPDTEAIDKRMVQIVISRLVRRLKLYFYRSWSKSACWKWCSVCFAVKLVKVQLNGCWWSCREKWCPDRILDLQEIWWETCTIQKRFVFSIKSIIKRRHCIFEVRFIPHYLKD